MKIVKGEDNEQLISRIPSRTQYLKAQYEEEGTVNVGQAKVSLYFRTSS